MSSELSKCVSCKKEKDLTLFMKNNVKLKCCFNCREKSRLNKIKTKCPHGKRKYTCKICGDKLKITIKNMMNHSREKDKKHNRFNEFEFIDYPFLENLIKESNLICYYPFCKKKLNLDKSNPALVSIERLDNSISRFQV